MEAINVGSVVKLAAQRWRDNMWCRLPEHQGLPVRAIGDAERDGFRLYAYSKWFMHDMWQVGKSFISHLFDQERVRVVARVRMGVHWLNADRVKALPRSRRVCKCCRLHVREDELHLLECPGYEI